MLVKLTLARKKGAQKMLVKLTPDQRRKDGDVANGREDEEDGHGDDGR